MPVATDYIAAFFNIITDRYNYVRISIISYMNKKVKYSLSATVLVLALIILTSELTKSCWGNAIGIKTPIGFVGMNIGWCTYKHIDYSFTKDWEFGSLDQRWYMLGSTVFGTAKNDQRHFWPPVRVVFN